MNITLTDKQYQTMLQCVGVAGQMYGIMKEALEEDYSEMVDNISEIETILLEHNTDPSIEEMHEGKKVFSEKYIDLVGADVMKYEDYVFFDQLVIFFAKKLAWADANEEKIFELTDELYEYFTTNGLKDVKFTGKL